MYALVWVIRDPQPCVEAKHEPLRPELYRFCRHLTRSPWEAEDVTQDALARAFVTLACMRDPPANPRAWLLGRHTT